MAYISDAALEGGLDYVDTNADELFWCSQEPTTYAEASSTYALADGTPSFAAIADGDTSGRKLTLESGSVTGSASGTATHWGLCKNSGSELIMTGALAASVATSNTVGVIYNAADVWETRDAVSE